MGFALSRYSGLWVGLKCVHDTVESSAVVDAGLDRLKIVMPGEERPQHSPNDDRYTQEERLHRASFRRRWLSRGRMASTGS